MGTFANSEDPDEMLSFAQMAAYHLGVYGLLR